MTRRSAVVAVLGAVVLGCDKAIENPEVISIDKVPKNVMDVAKQTWPDVEFEKAWTGKFDGEVAYEIRGRTENGKTREVRVSASGTVLEKE